MDRVWSPELGASGKRQRARSSYSIPRIIPPQARASRIKLRGSSAIRGGYCHGADLGARFGFGCLISLSMPAPRSGCLDLGKSVVTLLRMSRSRKECRHLAPDVSISERVSSPRSGCLDLGKGVGSGPQLHKRRLYELRGHEHICEYEYVCELRGYE